MANLNAPDAASAGPGGARAWIDHNLAMTDLVTVGTHNSYHLAMPAPVLERIARNSPEHGLTLDYTHVPLVDQLNDGARALELDIVHDPEGGRHADPVAARALGLPLDPAWLQEMHKPGFKVLHILDWDYHSTVPRYAAGLAMIRDWSADHPDHTPILLTMNTNDSKSTSRTGTDGLAFNEAAYDALDAEIRSVIPPHQLLTPDDVRGDYPTLREAVLDRGWPKLGAARGRIFFVVDEPPHHIMAYRGARASLEGRVCFVNTDEDSPAAGYITLNEMSDGPRIRAAVKAGYMVRTRADADTREARSGDTARRDAAFASGAQYISTDYRRPDPRFTDYQVRLPGGAIALPNPLRQPERCAGFAIE